MICSREKIVGASGAIMDYSLWKFKMMQYLYGFDYTESSCKCCTLHWGHPIIPPQKPEKAEENLERCHSTTTAGKAEYLSTLLHNTPQVLEPQGSTL
jgi:hypothetical protein